MVNKSVLFIFSFWCSVCNAQTYPNPTFGSVKSITNRTSAPTSYGNWNSPTQSFTGDLSTVAPAHQYNISGASTLTQPSSGYVQYQENSGEIISVYNTSGWNNSNTSNSGRTGVSAHYSQLYQYGQGDLTGYFCNGIVASTKTGSQSYLANPESACLAGQIFGAVNGAYAEFIGDMNISDLGAYDIAAAGGVFNFNRTIATENNGANWVFDFVQSLGIAPIDSVFRAIGPIITGIDFGSATMNYARLSYVTISNGGSGYVVGDNLTVSGGTFFTPAIFQVAAVSLGQITGLTMVNTGIYSAPPNTNLAPITVTGGSGSGVSLNASFEANDFILLPANGGCIKPSANVGTAVTTLTGNGGSICVYQNKTQINNSVLQLQNYTVATLPTCSATYKGGLAYVTDALAPTYNGTLTGGGAVVIPVFCNGTSWTSH